MSLTSIIKSGMGKIISDSIKIPEIDKSKSIIAPPMTKNYSLIGTAFDYLLRSEIERRSKNGFLTVEAPHLIGDYIVDAAFEGYIYCKLNNYNNAIPDMKNISHNEIYSEIANGKVYDMGLYADNYINDIINNNHVPPAIFNNIIHLKSPITVKDLAEIVTIGYNYHKLHDKFINDGKLTDDYIIATIKFANLDSIFRALAYKATQNIDPLDVEDMRNLYNAIPDNFFDYGKKWILDAIFGKASEMAGGADVDLIIDNSIIDIKTTKNLRLDSYMWGQIVGYYILSEIENKKNIDHIGIYFSRYGYLWNIDTDYITKNNNYNNVKSLMMENL